MPELPEVETTRLSLLPHLLGRRIVELDVRVERLRTVLDAAQLQHHLIGARIEALRRRGKYLLADLHHGQVLLIHLGMSGRLSIDRQTMPDLGKHDHVVWRFDDGGRLRFTDPRRFGLVELFAAEGELSHPRLRRLGLEPLGEEFAALTLRQAAAGSRLPIKTLLMDANRLVGVGNIYASEALFAAGIHPQTPADRLSPARWRRLATAIQYTLNAAIDQGGTTLRDFASAEGQAGYFGSQLQVYGRQGEPCVACRQPIQRLVQSGRSTYFCPTCQREQRGTQGPATRKLATR